MLAHTFVTKNGLRQICLPKDQSKFYGDLKKYLMVLSYRIQRLIQALSLQCLISKYSFLIKISMKELVLGSSEKCFFAVQFLIFFSEDQRVRVWPHRDQERQVWEQSQVTHFYASHKNGGHLTQANRFSQPLILDLSSSAIIPRKYQYQALSNRLSYQVSQQLRGTQVRVLYE